MRLMPIAVLSAIALVKTAAGQAPGQGAAPAAGATVSYSKLKWAVCTGSASQQFDFDTGTGLWTDVATGRCMSVLDKEQPYKGLNFGAVVLDTCGGHEYSGTPSGQKWTAVPTETTDTPVDMQSPLPAPVSPPPYMGIFTTLFPNSVGADTDY